MTESHKNIMATDLASLISSRICHDLISPIGALNTAIEVLDDTSSEEMHEDALRLIKLAASQASAKLSYLRIALGSNSTSKGVMNLEKLKFLTENMFNTDKHRFYWAASELKLEKNIVERRIKYLEDSGIKFFLNVNIGKDISFQEIRKKHEAILIATGVYKPRKLDVKTNYPNIHPALDFLTASNKKGLGDKVELFDDGTLNAEGKDVIVIGGGDTAMDCVRTSVRQNAKSVKCLYRRDRENMPGSTREVLNAEEEGVEFIWQSIPKSFHGDSKIKEVICAKTKLSEPDASGRQVPIEIENSEFSLKADIVIEALGFDPEDLPKLFNEKELPITKWGTIKTSFSTLMTELDGVFAAGDIARGASLVVWGIRDGRDAAESIHSYVEAKNQEIVKAS